MLFLLLLGTSALADEGFEKNIRPLLVEQCLKCHGPTKQSGGLRLDSRDALLTGGDSGPAAVSGKPEESLLVKAVAYSGELKMPPKGKLADGDAVALSDWIRRGLPWPDSKDARGGKAKALVTDEHRRWWAYQPVRPVAPPAVKNTAWPRSGIDRFILACLEAKGFPPAPPADKRTLLRRATFDLTGLPPTPEEIVAFLKDDSPQAFARVVDRLLASPAYGERWGRHWLDVVRYADYYQTNPKGHGSNDKFELHEAYRYRDWVVSAFNRDLPYDQFVTHQIAGDRLSSVTSQSPYVDGLVATGFLSIGSWDHGDADKDKIVSDIVDDQIEVVGKAFLGLTLSCARCHDHKFDPIGTDDYYALAGMFYSTRTLADLGTKGDHTLINRVPLIGPPALAERKRQEDRLAEITSLLAEKDITGRFRALSAGGEALIPTRFVSKAGAVGTIHKDGIITITGPATRDEYTIEAIVPKGVTIKAVRLEALADPALPGKGPGRAGNGNFVVTGFAATFGPVKSSAPSTPLRFVRAQADFEQDGLPVSNSLAGKANQGWAVHPREGADHVAVYEVAAETAPAEGTRLVFTIGHGYADLHTLGRFRLAVLSEVPVIKPDHDDPAWRKLDTERSQLQSALAVPVPLALGVSEGGTPGSLYPGVQDVKLHTRGSYTKLGPVVKRRLPQFFAGTSQPEVKGSGRLELSQWIAHADNPLTARVMVNRIWQHHFGEGIVRTPSNFGKLGEAPTHPELFDWLAVQFIQDGWSVKAMHRRIMLSATYQQGSVIPKDLAAKDAENRLFGRFSPRRLEAEAIRDAMLSVSGQLDLTPGGPALAEVNIKRRSLYVSTTRWDRSNYSTLFDAANPDQAVEKRGGSTVAPQALFLLNNPFVQAQAKHLAARLKSAATDDPARVRLAYELLFARPPRDDELRLGLRFLAATRWDEYAHALLCSNEFVFID